MQPIRQDDIFALIAEINAFADNSENLINATQKRIKVIEKHS